MDIDFWKQRWREQKIGFHLDEVNPYLQLYWDRLAVPPPARILVPLCGKTQDLGYLADRGYDVVGVEISPVAVSAFFNEQSRSASRETIDGWAVWHSPSISIWCADFFALEGVQLGRFDAIYDRAALIALPSDMRRDYVAHLRAFAQDAPQLLITLDYDQSQMEGPPFAVDTNEVMHLYGDDFDGSDSPVTEIDVLSSHARFAELGLSHLVERVYVLSPRKITTTSHF